MIITELWIPGRPVTKGSLTVVNGIPKDTPQSKAWRRIMAGAVRDDLYRREPFKRSHTGPVHVTALWWLPSPVTQRGAGDIDKLVRNLLDALSAPGQRTEDTSLCAGAIVDDNQVQGVESWKFHDPAQPGVLVRVVALSSDYLDGADSQHRAWRATLTA